MAFELGGRADKFGNRYERRYFVSLMAKVLQGGLHWRSVTGVDHQSAATMLQKPDIVIVKCR